MTTISSGPSRRRVLQSMGAGVAAWAVGQTQPGFNILRSPRAEAGTGPDVYVVTLDDCSPEYIGYYQSILPTAYQGPIHTPELDALLAASWTASAARAPVAVCMASRSSFLTGAGPNQTGIFGDEGFKVAPAMSQFLNKVTSGQLVTLPGFLTAQGLNTAVRGKVDHTGGLFNIPGQIVNKGTYTNINSLLQDPNYSPNGFGGSDGSYMPYAVLPSSVQHVDALRVDEQIARINSPYSGQRVDFLGFMQPHTPRTVHQSWVDLYNPADIQLRTNQAEIAADQADIPATSLAVLESPYFGNGIPRSTWMYANLTEAGLKAHIHHMLATLSHTSFQIGRLRTALDAAGRPYVIVLTSDHGYFMGEKGHYQKGGIYDKALRVPLAIYSSAGSTAYPVGNVTHPITLQGLPRTVAQLAGISTSLLPSSWTGRRFDDSSNGCFIHTWGASKATQSIAMVWRADGIDRKLIVHPGDAGELYDLTADPGEVDNLLVPNAGATPAEEAARSASRAQAEAELELRARQQRAADWLARHSLRSEANT